MALTLPKFQQDGTGAVNRDFTDKLKEVVSVLDFGADPTASASVNTSAFNAAFASGAKRVVAEPGAVYAVNGQINITSSLEFDGQGCTINANLPIGTRLFQVTAATSIKNVTLDFNDGYALNAINFPTSDVGYLELVNVVVCNIYDIDTTSITIPINFHADQNEVRFDKITLKNIKKRSNLNSADAEGGIEGIYLYVGASGIGGGGYLNNITIENMSTVNSSDVVVEDACNAIYLAYGLSTIDRRANISINNVKGYDFGRRLFKIQADNVLINNVFAESSAFAALSGIGIQDYDTIRAYNIQVRNAILRGKMRYGVYAGADDVVLDGIDCVISLRGVTNPYGSNALGIGVAGDNLKITNSTLTADYGLYMARASGYFAGALKNVQISDTTFIPTVSSGSIWTLQESTGIEVIDSITFNNITVDATLFPANMSSGVAAKTNGTLIANNITVIDNDGAANGGSGFYVEGFSNVSVSNYTHVNKNVSSQVFRSMRFATCGSVQLNNITIQAVPASISISTSGVTSLDASNMRFNSSITNGLYLATTTATRISGADRAKVNLSDTTSRSGCLFAPEFSTGTTAQRPTSGLLAGQQYWDTTLSKPIWWNGTVWKDAAGTTV